MNISYLSIVNNPSLMTTMERMLKNVIKGLLSKTEALRRERDVIISRCQRNCRSCAQEDCPNRVFIRARPNLTLVRGGQM